MKWKVLLDNKQWSICRPPADIQTIMTDSSCENIFLGLDITIYPLGDNTDNLPVHLRKYSDDTYYHHWQDDMYAHYLQKNGKKYLMHVPENRHFSQPIILPASIASGTLYVVIGAGASVVLNYDQSSYASITIHLEPYARLHWNHRNASVCNDGYTYLACYQQKESHLMFNGYYTRTTYNNMFFVLREPRAVAEVALKMHAKEPHHGWFKTVQIHEASATRSSLILKGLLASDGRSAHMGMIHITDQAKKSEAQLFSHYLLVHNDAQAYSRPSLEVVTNDVICSHGSSIGSYDDDHLFFLMSRGIALENCYHLLSDAFLSN